MIGKYGYFGAGPGRAPYRFSTEQLLGNIRILDAVTRSAAADGKPIML